MVTTIKNVRRLNRNQRRLGVGRLVRSVMLALYREPIKGIHDLHNAKPTIEHYRRRRIQPAIKQTESNAVEVTAIVDGDRNIEMTADLTGLDIFVEPGSYWFGLTPITDFEKVGQEFRMGSPLIGDNSAFRNFGGGFGIGINWFSFSFDASLRITGKKVVIPEPSTASLLALGCIGSFIRRRR